MSLVDFYTNEVGWVGSNQLISVKGLIAAYKVILTTSAFCFSDIYALFFFILFLIKVRKKYFINMLTIGLTIVFVLSISARSLVVLLKSLAKKFKRGD